MLRTTSRDTLNTKSASVSNIFVMNCSAVCIEIWGHLAVTRPGHVAQNEPANLRSRISGRKPTGCATTAAAMRFGARFNKFQMKGPPMQKPITANLSIPR